MSTAPLTTWLECLRAISSVKGILHLGPGYGVGELSKWSTKFTTASVHLIEANPKASSHLERIFEQKKNIQVANKVVMPLEESWKFHTYDNSSESCLLNLDVVHQYWPYIKQTNESLDQTYPEGIFFQEYIKNYPGINWLIVDCLPAATLIRSMGSYIDQMDVVIARTLIKGESDALGCTVASTTQLLQKHSFRLVHIQAERNPAIGIALYVKDLHATETLLKKRLGNLESHNQELAARLSKQAELISYAEQQLEEIKDLIVERDLG